MWSVRGIASFVWVKLSDQVDTVSHAWDGCLLHQNPFVICIKVSVVFEVYLYMPFSDIWHLLFNHIWPCAGGPDDPGESDMLNWITVPCPRGMGVGTEKNLWWMKMTWDILDLCCVLLSLGWRKWSNEIIKQSNLMCVVFWKCFSSVVTVQDLWSNVLELGNCSLLSPSCVKL